MADATMVDETEESAFSPRRRFGGNEKVRVGQRYSVDVGDLIMGEAPGVGVAAVPWILARYERVLRLRPADSWLLQRLVRQAWSLGKPVYPSIRKMEAEACVSRSTIHEYMIRLKKLHYIKVVSRGSRFDKRIRYDVSPLYAALALCIMADPMSKHAKKGGLMADEPTAKRWAKGWPFMGKNYTFNLDFDALYALDRRSTPVQDDGGDEAEYDEEDEWLQEDD